MEKLPYSIYNADVYCRDCANQIKNHIGPISSWEKEDSDHYPQPVSPFSEADSPQHCGCYEECVNAITLPSGRKIGALLDCDLTTEGETYVKRCRSDEVTELWLDVFDLRERCDFCGASDNLSLDEAGIVSKGKMICAECLKEE